MSLLLLSLRRIVRSPWSWLALAVATALALGSAWVQHRHHAPHGADHTLLNLYATVAVPLLTFGLVSAALEGGGLARSGRAVVWLGVSPVAAARTTLLVSCLVCGLLCGALGAGVVAWAHGASDPPLARDALHTLGFGALGGASYAAYFGLGSAVGASGWGRWLLLAVDVVVGQENDLAAALTPKAHLRNLLGGSSPFDLLPGESLVVLGVLAVTWVVFATMVAGRSRTARGM